MLFSVRFCLFMNIVVLIFLFQLQIGGNFLLKNSIVLEKRFWTMVEMFYSDGFVVVAFNLRCNIIFNQYSCKVHKSQAHKKQSKKKTLHQ